MAGVNPFILGAQRFQVIAPMVVAMLPGDAQRYVYRGGLLPAETLPSQIASMLHSGLVKEVSR
ncbi:hypothetical protein [Microbacterium aurum]